MLTQEEAVRFLLPSLPEMFSRRLGRMTCGMGEQRDNMLCVLPQPRVFFFFFAQLRIARLTVPDGVARVQE